MAYVALLYAAIGAYVSGYKSLLGGVLIGGIVILMLVFMNIMILGADYGKKFPFITYKALSLVKIGEFLTRLEIIGAVIFTISIFMKASMILLAACKGAAKIFGFDDYRFLVVPMTLLIGVTTVFTYESSIEYFKTFTGYIAFALPFEVVLPFILFVFIEIKYRVLKKKNMLPVQ